MTDTNSAALGKGEAATGTPVPPAPPKAAPAAAAPVAAPPAPAAPKPAEAKAPAAEVKPAPAAPAKPAPAKPAAPAAAPAKPAAPAAKPAPPPERPIPPAAKLQPRHRGILMGLLFAVAAPLLLASVYLWTFATDQYASVVGFTVRQEDNPGASALLGGLAQFAGAGGARDSDILYEYIRSQQVVEAVDTKLDLRSLYSRNWPGDPVFALEPDATIEELLKYWQSMVRVSYDQNSGLIELRVLAFSAQDAQNIAREILNASQAVINDLNIKAREDVMRHALADLEEAVARLKTDREAMTHFRTRTQIVDPESDIQGQLGVLANLQQQLAQALIDSDLLLETTSPSDPRVTQSRRRIEAIRSRIVEERRSFTSGEGRPGDLQEDYPTLMAEYESLAVDREFAEQSYRAALSAVELARAQATRQSRYLAAYIQPTLPQTAEYPQRFMMLGLLALFLTMTWSILALVYYSIRDRR